MSALRALFPLDGSPATYQAVERGLTHLAGVPGAQATFLVVISKKFRDMPEDASEHLREDTEDELFITDDEARDVIDRATDIAKRVKFAKVEGKVVIGDPKDAILAEASTHDVLVMHRMRTDERAEKRSGGFLEDLARGASCDVWLMHTD